MQMRSVVSGAAGRVQGQQQVAATGNGSDQIESDWGGEKKERRNERRTLSRSHAVAGVTLVFCATLVESSRPSTCSTWLRVCNCALSSLPKVRHRHCAFSSPTFGSLLEPECGLSPGRLFVFFFALNSSIFLTFWPQTALVYLNKRIRGIQSPFVCCPRTPSLFLPSRFFFVIQRAITHYQWSYKEAEETR